MEHTAPAILEIGLVLLVAAGAGWLARAAAAAFPILPDERAPPVPMSPG